MDYGGITVTDYGDYGDSLLNALNCAAAYAERSRVVDPVPLRRVSYARKKFLSYSTVIRL